eukprot:44927-Chlamydomonas_euryale.AAC.1
MHAPCIPHARPMHAPCTPHARPMHTPCMPDARPMHTGAPHKRGCTAPAQAQPPCTMRGKRADAGTAFLHHAWQARSYTCGTEAAAKAPRMLPARCRGASVLGSIALHGA